MVFLRLVNSKPFSSKSKIFLLGNMYTSIWLIGMQFVFKMQFYHKILEEKQISFKNNIQIFVNKFYSVERKLRHPIQKFNHAYCLTLNRACCCRLRYLMSSSLCALPQYVCVLLRMVLDPRDAADTRSSLSAVFQVGGLQVICA